MLLALATRRDLPGWEVDDRHLHAALRQRGVPFELAVWDDPAVDWGRYDAVLLRTPWDYQDKLPAFRAFVDRVAGCSRLFNPPAVVHWNAHKHYLRELAARGAPLAPTEWLARGSAVDVGALVARHGWAEGFLKPCVGATARETLRFAATAPGLRAAQAHVDRLLPGEDLMLQPFLPAVLERGEWSAIAIDGAIAHCVRKVPVPGDYRVQDDFGARDEAYRPTDAERALAERVLGMVAGPAGVLAAVPAPLLYARADFLWTPTGECVVTELELIEPSLFFRHGPDTAARLADALLRRLGGSAQGRQRLL